MNKSIPFGIAFVLTAVFSAAGWWILPSLQDAKRTVDIEASTEIERARRLLHQYDAGLNYKSLLSAQLFSYVEELDPDDLSEDVEDEYQQLHETLWASYRPMDWDRGSPARANYGNLPRQIRDGIGGMDRNAKRNDRFLDQALSAVDRALAVSSGSESARVHPEANRLKAVALYHKGLSLWMEAQVLRREADQFRRELTNLAGEASTASAASARFADSNIADDIETLLSEADDLEANVEEGSSDAEEVEDTIADLEERLAEQVSDRNDARNAIERLKAYGADPSDAHAATRFGEELAVLGKAYRGADREAHAIEFGTYATAEIDDRGDYLTSRYVEPGTLGDPDLQFGLAHYRDTLRILSATVANQERRLEDIRGSIARLEAVQNSLSAEADRSKARVRRAAETAAEAFPELSQIDADAFTIEENALNLLDRAAGAAKSAAGFARQWVSSAQIRTRDLSPEAKGLSAFEKRSKAGWVGAFVAAQEADARLAKAWIHYARYRSASQNAATFARVAQVLQLGEADAQAEKDKAQHAHDVGVAEITQAVNVLERSHRNAAKHWTLTAQAAGTTYLLALFGHEDYVPDAIAGYRNAVTGRENDRFAAPFVTRLSKLESR